MNRPRRPPLRRARRTRVLMFLPACLLVASAGLTPLRGIAAASSPGVWRILPAPIVPPSGDHTATILQDGRVLLVGGRTCGSQCNFDDAGVRAAELYDPVPQRWTATGSTLLPREYHTATLLRDGRVLVAGGGAFAGPGDFGGVSATAEIYSPQTGRWEGAAPMRSARLGHSATLLSNGKVLVAGGISARFVWQSSTELFDPVSGRWSDGGTMGFARSDHTATLLGDGTVLVAGGRGGVGGRRPPEDTPALRAAELYDPATNLWRPVPHLLHSPRVNHTATLLDDGSVLLAGGAVVYYHGGTGDPTGSVEIYHPTSRTLTDAPALPEPRFAHSATRLTDGRVLITGGLLVGDNVRAGLQHHNPAAPEIFDPATGVWAVAAPMVADPSTHAKRRDIETRLSGDHTSTLLRDGTVLVVGGDDASRSAQLFDPAFTSAGATTAWGSGALVRVAIGAGIAIVAAGGCVWALRRRASRAW